MGKEEKFMRQYEMCEVIWTGEERKEFWADAAPRVVFTCGNARQEVRGFYAGDGEYKARFLPDRAGVWEYEITDDRTVRGCVEVAEAKTGAHGIVKAAGCSFVHQDGTHFYPFGTTVYALMHQKRELVNETFRTLEGAPFNKVRMCVFPKHYDFNHEDPELYAFEKDEKGNWDVSRPCIAFWDYMDEIITRLGNIGIEADLILFHPYDRWGFSGLSQEENLIYLDYAIRRLSAYPNIWWSIANEYDLVPGRTMEEWNQIDEFISTHDPHHHLLSNHNCFARYDFTRDTITHCSIQTKAVVKVAEWRKRYQKPISIDECCYEGNIIHPWGSISGREMTYRFWRTVVQGGYCTHGETFYAEDEVLWWARGGRLKGESPERIAFLRKIVEQFPGPIEPYDSNHIMGISNLPAEDREKMTGQIPEQHRHFVEAILRMPQDEAELFGMFEYSYVGHVGEEVYLTFYDIRTCAKGCMELPADQKYKLELVDVYDMTIEEVDGVFSGHAVYEMPGKEGMAVIARRISE